MPSTTTQLNRIPKSLEPIRKTSQSVPASQKCFPRLSGVCGGTYLLSLSLSRRYSAKMTGRAVQTSLERVFFLNCPHFSFWSPDCCNPLSWYHNGETMAIRVADASDSRVAEHIGARGAAFAVPHLGRVSIHLRLLRHPPHAFAENYNLWTNDFTA